MPPAARFLLHAQKKSGEKKKALKGGAQRKEKTPVERPPLIIPPLVKRQKRRGFEPGKMKTSDGMTN